MNPWEVTPYEYAQDGQVDTQAQLIYPGLYSTSSYDMLSILVQIFQRPNPQVELGPVDCSCPLIMCDLMQPDQPIVYVSDAFFYLTGYSAADALGKNCRFMQAPASEGKVKPRSVRKHVDKDTLKRMRKAVDKKTELQIEVVNFKKNGARFVNLLTMIPVNVNGRDYCVGFQCEKD